ncbi:MAG TPA: AAA family ATPase, partial [Guyparkeria sp.]|nr:AAA family ATPase [Guyparkeria sp.]
MSEHNIDQYRIQDEPYYQPVSNEVELYEAAYSVRMPIMLKGPTGCGKTRFVAHMAHKLGKP